MLCISALFASYAATSSMQDLTEGKLIKEARFVAKSCSKQARLADGKLIEGARFVAQDVLCWLKACN